MTVPYTFANQTGSIPLSELDANFSNVSNYSSSAGTVVGNTQLNITSVGNLVSLSVVGNVTGSYFLGNGSQLTGLAATYGNANVVANLAALGSNPVSTTGNVSANFFVGNGSQLTGIAATYGNANVVANLAALGTNPVSTTGNITGGNIRTVGLITATGNVSGNYFLGNGSQLTGIAATYGNANVVANLAALGTNPVSTTGNITGGNIRTVGLMTATGNITANYFVGNGSLLTGIGVSGYGNANVVANLAALGTNPVSTTGNVSANFFVGNGSLLTGLAATYGNANVVANLAALGTNPISTTGNVTGGNVSVGTGTISVGNLVNNNANGVGNLGSATTYFNTVFAKATSAQYADLAENYLADAPYAPGTVVSIGGDAEVTQSSIDADSTVIGVVSTNPAYHMNAGLAGGYVVPVALTGRVPCRVTGSVNRGSALVSNGDGTARSEESPHAGTIIGKALTAFEGSSGVVEVVVGRF